jgi:YjbE family integral membrane protein
MPSANFLLGGLSIILIDLLLAGDNALVIALAVRALPKRERRLGIAGGAALAVVLRVILTSVAARLLTLPFLQLAGGLLVLWIAFKVLVDATDPPDAAPAPRRLLQAIWYITAADVTMSLDNILAIAGASRGDLRLIVFGLALSIPFVVFSSNLLARLMDRYPVTVYVGVAILCKVAGDMILADQFVVRRLHPSTAARYATDAALIVGVLIVGTRVGRTRRERVTDRALEQ